MVKIHMLPLGWYWPFVQQDDNMSRQPPLHSLHFAGFWFKTRAWMRSSPCRICIASLHVDIGHVTPCWASSWSWQREGTFYEAIRSWLEPSWTLIQEDCLDLQASSMAFFEGKHQIAVLVFTSIGLLPLSRVLWFLLHWIEQVPVILTQGSH